MAIGSICLGSSAGASLGCSGVFEIKAIELLLLLVESGGVDARRAGMIWKASSGLLKDTDFLRAAGPSVWGRCIPAGGGVVDLGLIRGALIDLGVAEIGALTTRLAALFAAAKACDAGFGTGLVSVAIADLVDPLLPVLSGSGLDKLLASSAGVG